MKAYMSHSIRGRAGDAATDEVMLANNKKAIEVGVELRKRCPGLRLYIPAEMDLFLQSKGIEPKNIPIDPLLDFDCEIVGLCDTLLVYMPDDYVSHGMQVEIKHALIKCMQVYYFSEVSDEVVKTINSLIKDNTKEN